MSVLKIALLQMASHGTDQEANKRKGEAYCRRAREMGADIALFPEMWNIGYTAYASEVLLADYDPTHVDADEAWRSQAKLRRAAAKRLKPGPPKSSSNPNLSSLSI